MTPPPSRIPVRIEMRPMQPAPAPVGRAVKALAREHWSTTFADAVTAHVWRREALDAFESHSFTGTPQTQRWCTRCTLVLQPGWKDPRKPVPLHCGDSRIRPHPAVYEYADGNPVNGLRPADPHYSGAKITHG